MLRATALGMLISTAANAASSVSQDILKVLSTYNSDVFDDGAAEIVAHDPGNQRIFTINASATTVDVLDINDPQNLMLMKSIDASDLGGAANSVAIYEDIVAVAIEAKNKQSPGLVAFYDATDLNLIDTVTVGALPDMLTFTPNGKYVLVANEGEPDDNYEVDPEGSISIIDISNGVKHASVRTADFKAFNARKDQLIARGVRIFGPGATVAQDLEPEYITVGKKSRLAWAVMQEANALAIIDIKRAKVLKIVALGTKDHNLPGNELDASNKDGVINITNWPVKGFYMPDAIDSYSFFGFPLIVTANEGDSRDYDGFSEEERIKDLTLDPEAFPDAATLQQDANLGRLKTTTVNGDTDGDGDFDELYSYGARSFSIWTGNGRLLYDSGSDFEEITAKLFPADFNSTNDDNDSFDNRSDDKGPEPEGIVVGKIKGSSYAFIGLERKGGIMVYDITNPFKVKAVGYTNNRDFSVKATDPLAGDLGPEGLVFIPASDSPNGKPLLVTGNEVSGTTTVFQVDIKQPRSRSWKWDSDEDLRN